MIIEFTGASNEQIKEVLSQAKAAGHSPVWEDTDRLSSKNTTTISWLRKAAKKLKEQK